MQLALVPINSQESPVRSIIFASALSISLIAGNGFAKTKTPPQTIKITTSMCVKTAKEIWPDYSPSTKKSARHQAQQEFVDHCKRVTAEHTGMKVTLSQ